MRGNCIVSKSPLDPSVLMYPPVRLGSGIWRPLGLRLPATLRVPLRRADPGVRNHVLPGVRSPVAIRPLLIVVIGIAESRGPCSDDSVDGSA